MNRIKQMLHFDDKGNPVIEWFTYFVTTDDPTFALFAYDTVNSEYVCELSAEEMLDSRYILFRLENPKITEEYRQRIPAFVANLNVWQEPFAERIKINTVMWRSNDG